MAENKVLIDVIVKASDSIKEIVSLKDRVKELTEARKTLDITTVEGRELDEAYATEIRATNVEIRNRRKEVDKNIALAEQEKGSLDSLAISLSQMKKEYRSLSEADRNSAEGMAMRDTIKATNDALEIAEAAYGDYYRQIGKYEKAGESTRAEIEKLNNDLKGLADQFLALSDAEKQADIGKEIIAQMNAVQGTLADTTQTWEEYSAAQQESTQNITSLISGNNDLIGSLIQTVSSGQGVTAAFRTMGIQAKAFGKSLLALALNPVVLTIVAIVGAAMLLMEAFKRNEDNATKLNVVIGKLSGVFNWLLDKLEPVAVFLVDVLIKAFEDLAKTVEWTIGIVSDGLRFLGFDDAANSVDNFTKSVAAASAAAGELAKKEAELKKEQRDAQRIQLEYQKNAEKLRQIRDDDTKSMAERLKANEELGKVLKQQMEAELAIAQKALDIANLRLQVEGQTTANLDARAEALTKISDIQERITGQESEQLNNRNSLRKEAADKAFELAQKSLDQQLKLNEARIKAESDFQSEDFFKRQSYEKRLFELSQKSESDKLAMQRRFGKITQKDYEIEKEVLVNARKEFDNSQSKASLDFYKEQRKALFDLIDKDADAQIKELETQYNKALKDFEKLKPERKEDQDLIQYTRTDEYKAYMLERAKFEKQIETQKAKEIQEIKKTSLAKQASDIEKAINEQYKGDLAKYSDNERKRTQIEIQELEDRIAQKKAKNLDYYEDEASLRNAQNQANIIDLDIELLKTNENARAKYEAKKAYLEKESEIYKDNADRQAQIAHELAENEKEYMEARIAMMEKYGSAVGGILSGISDLSSSIESSQLQQYEENNAKKKEDLDNRLKMGLISQSEYDKQIADSDAELEKKKAQAARKQAIREKALKVFEIGMNTASGIMKAISASPLTFGLPWSAFVAATGAIQLASVIAAPLPKAARGMYIKGNSHANGGVQIEAEGGEVIMTKRSVEMYGPLLSAMNVAGGGIPFSTPMSDGGFTSRASQSSKNLSSEDLAGLVKKAVQDVRIYTTVEDYRRADLQYTTISDRKLY